MLRQRNFYIRKFLENRSKPETAKLQEVYLDESYIHQHYVRHEDSIYDPNDEQDEQLRKPNKGRRICFLSAIRYKCGNNLSELISNSVWHFTPSAKNQKGDYHKAFNGQNFLNWFESQLIPNLVRPSLIILDNASYHKCLLQNFLEFLK